MIVTRDQFPDFFKSTMAPALDVIQTDGYEMPEAQREHIFNIEKMTGSVATDHGFSGVGRFHEMEEGADIRFDRPVPLFKKFWQPSRFGLGIEVSYEAVADDQVGLIKDMALQLGRSARDTKEAYAAAVLDNGFNPAFAGPDSKPLFATDHPLVKAQGVQSNKLAIPADLSVTSLQTALTLFMTMKDSTGKPIVTKPDHLIIPATLQFTAVEVLGVGSGGLMRSDTGNNTVNAFKNVPGVGVFDGVIAWRYLQDDDAWFVAGKVGTTGLVIKEREKLSKGRGYNDYNDVGFTKMTYREAIGWRHPWGVVGSQGS